MQENGYFTIRASGFVTYCDALIARKDQNNSNLQAVLMSLIGTPSHIKTTSAILFGNDPCFIVNENEDRPLIKLDFLGNPRTYRARKIGDIVNKIMISSCYFEDRVENQEESEPSRRHVVVYGADVPSIIERAFLRLNASTGVPLKSKWQGWLWDEIMQPEKLYSFGGKELREACLISWPKDKDLQEKVLEGVAAGYLT